jgi:isoleucyl-tRNA synthetase
LHYIFEFLIKWLSPIISFTAEEAWQTRHYSNSQSILRQVIKDTDFNYQNQNIEKSFNELKRVRKTITAALEIKRNEKLIGSSLQASVNLFIKDTTREILKDINLAEMCIVSNVEIHDIKNKTKNCLTFDDDDIFVEILLAQGEKCQRCWTILPEVKSNKNNLCQRCDDVWKSLQN